MATCSGGEDDIESRPAGFSGDTEHHMTNLVGAGCHLSKATWEGRQLNWNEGPQSLLSLDLSGQH